MHSNKSAIPYQSVMLGCNWWNLIWFWVTIPLSELKRTSKLWFVTSKPMQSQVVQIQGDSSEWLPISYPRDWWDANWWTSCIQATQIGIHFTNHSIRNSGVYHNQRAWLFFTFYHGIHHQCFNHHLVGISLLLLQTSNTYIYIYSFIYIYMCNANLFWIHSHKGKPR